METMPESSGGPHPWFGGIPAAPQTLGVLPAWLGVLGSPHGDHSALQPQDCGAAHLGAAPLPGGPRHRDHMSHTIRSTFIDRLSRSIRGSDISEASGGPQGPAQPPRTAVCAGDARTQCPTRSGQRREAPDAPTPAGRALGPSRVSLAGWGRAAGAAPAGSLKPTHRRCWLQGASKQRPLPILVRGPGGRGVLGWFRGSQTGVPMPKRGLVLLEANRTHGQGQGGGKPGGQQGGSSWPALEPLELAAQLGSTGCPGSSLSRSPGRLGPPSSTSLYSVWWSDSSGQRAGPCRYPLESRGRGRHGSPYAAYRGQGLLEGAWWPGWLIESVKGQEGTLPLPSSAVWAYGPGSNSPCAAAPLAGSIRDTISARSMKEALGQVSTLGAEAKETSGEAPDRSQPHPLYDPLWS